MPPQLHILTFGGLRFRVGDRVCAHFRTQKCAALLAYVAVHLGKPVHREPLMELLWPDTSPAAARRNLSTALWSLRQQLTEALGGGDEALETDRNTVTLRADRVETDVREFQQAIRAAQSAVAPAERIPHLVRAVDLYEGEFLQGLYEDWVLQEQTRLAGLYEKAVAEVCEVLESAGDISGALHHGLLAVRSDPLNQQACARVMHLYAAGGQPAAALAHFRGLERLLQRELETAPEPALRELTDRIARGDYPSSPVVAPPLPNPGPGPGPAVPDFDEPAPGYVKRPADAEFERAVAARESIILLKGPRETGKSSLLVRGLRKAREAGRRVVFTDLQALGAEELRTPDAFHRALAHSLAEQLELRELPREVWEPEWGPSLNLRRYLRRWVLRDAQQPLVWAIDEVDRLFTTPFYGDVFGLFRSWHNERSSEPEGPWNGLTLALAYSTEAHLFIPDLDQSPFNVGVRLEVDDFAPEQVAALNREHGKPLKNEAELARLRARLGGHPYLVRRALQSLKAGTATLPAIEETFGPFSDHLRGLAGALRRDPALCAVVRGLLAGEKQLSEESFFRLRSAGLIRGDAPDAVRFRCGLYRDYLQHQFGRD